MLVIAYPYPPMPSTGANRWAAMAKYLRRAGSEVTVLTTSAYGSLPSDLADGVVRTGDLIANERLRRVARRPRLPEPGGPLEVDKPAPSLFTAGLVPDIYVATWVPGAVRAARRLLRGARFDRVITTSPWESGHLVGLWLGRARPAWIADFRDAWCFEPWRDPFPTAPQRALDRTLERRVVEGADRVITVHKTLAMDFERRLGVPSGYVPNGWDPDLEEGASRADVPELDPDRVSIVHTGKLWGGWGRTPASLFEAIRRLRHEEPSVAARLELVLVGRLDSDEQRLLGAADLDGLVRHTGAVSRASSTALQRRADALLLLTSRRLSWEAPGKLFEYLAAGRPIICLGQGNEAARVVTETRTGVTTAPDDVEGIMARLRDLLAGRVGDSYSPQGLDRYVYPAPADLVQDEIERAIAHRKGGAGQGSDLRATA